MYHRIYTVLKDLVRLPQEIGNYSAIEHLRVCQDLMDLDIRDNTDRFDQASPEKEEDRPYESGKTTVTDSELGSGQPSRPDTFPSDVFDEIGVRSMQPWMHGENHPAVSIKVGSTPLKSKCLGEMSLPFMLLGPCRDPSTKFLWKMSR